MKMEWQPIETAPKDGTKILSFEDDEFAVVWWQLDRWGKEGQWSVTASRGGWYLSPTHWMPLPNPPEKENNG